jgi:hypothetical protein
MARLSTYLLVIDVSEQARMLFVNAFHRAQPEETMGSNLPDKGV